MRWRFRQRWVLVGLLSAGQFVCLALAVILFAYWVGLSAGAIARRGVLEACEQYAAQAAERIEAMGLTDLARSSPDWRRLQEFVQDTTLPNEGFLSVVDAEDGTIVCHGQLPVRPELAGTSLAGLILQGPDGRTLALGDAGSLAGRAETADGGQLIAIHSLPHLNLRVLAHQRQAPIDATIARFTGRLRAIGLVVAILLAGLLTLVTALIVRRYDSRLSVINENLEAIVATRSRSLLQSRSAVILGLAKLAESRDDQTGQHLERIGRYVKILGEQLKKTRPEEVTDEFIDTIIETSALHDIGKVGIPDQVLLKPGTLTDEQRAVIRKHPLIGGDTLLAVKQRWGDDQFLVTACEIAFSHHERWDGQGYPFGLAGDMIPLAGRIVALADVYDALTTERVYKPAIDHGQACQIIAEGAGTHFDPRVVDAFLAAEDEFRNVRLELDEQS